MHIPNTLQSDRLIGYALLRITLGINISLHGVSRLLAGISQFANGLVGMFHQTLLPGWLVGIFGYTLPWMETTTGVLVLFGLCTRFGLITGALLIFVLTFGTALRQDWNTAGLQLTYALTFAALLFLRDWNKLSVDGWLERTRKEN